MQTWSSQNMGGISSPVRKLASYSLLFFALAGLIAGFAFGGFSNRSHTTGNTGPARKQTPVVHITNTVTPTPTQPPDVELGIPSTVNLSASILKADGATTYTLHIQAIDKHKQAVHSPDITCKVWLMQQVPDKQTLSIDKNTLKAVNNLANPITGTINNTPAPEVGGLNFDTTTPQTHLCDAKGQMTWKFTVTPGVPPGDYDLVILTDWKGIHYNWSWDHVTIHQAGQN